jgi:hypothetical protein
VKGVARVKELQITSQHQRLTANSSRPKLKKAVLNRPEWYDRPRQVKEFQVLHRRYPYKLPFLAMGLLLLLEMEKPGSGLGSDDGWQSLFDGKTLQNWQVTNFGGQGGVTVEHQQIVLDFGSDLTGITWTGDLQKGNYELTLEAMRVDGSDFFCGLTFPVGDSFCSLIVGGWGGTVVGLSSIDGRDASENQTSRLMNFDSNRWYRVRLQVTETRIEAWIDAQKMIEQGIAGHKISIRPEVELSRPLGIASWRTKAALRDVRTRRLAGSR